jgi:hypothetical protein
MFKSKEHICKKIARKNLTKKKLWIFKWIKMSHIFINPYHNHFWVDFNFYFLNMYIKSFFRKATLHMGVLVY